MLINDGNDDDGDDDDDDGGDNVSRSTNASQVFN